MIRSILTLSLAGVLCALAGDAQTVSYQESFDNFANPERGFYRPLPAASAGSFAPLSAAELSGNRTNPYTPFSAAYQITNTLVFRYYILDGFKEGPISADYLNRMRTDLRAVREAGVKLIPRFAYTITPDQSGCPAPTACPPYGDAPKGRILEHIGQLKSVFDEYRDVIAVVQMGFIGIWGEQYYTDFFGDTSPNASQGRLLDGDWRDRNDVLGALLNAVPKSRMIQVRYPQLKQRKIYGITAPTSSAAVSAAQAHNGSDIARIGFHNDCFLSSPDDFGTYFDYGTSASQAVPATAALKSYFADDSRYTAVGGETCSDAFSPQNDCSGQAVSDMRRLHYSYLNSEYNNDVNNDWQADGCMAEVQRDLGYRFVMERGTYAANATPGQRFDFSLQVRNVGFAAPYNPRPAELVLRNTGSGATYKVPLTGRAADVRFWLPGEVATLNAPATLPADVPEGEYELLLNLPDTSNGNAIANRPAYAMRLANDGTWEAGSGYNKLNHTLTVGKGGDDGGGDGDVATLYLDCEFAGGQAGLTVGEYDMNALDALGIPNDKLSSIRVRSGHAVELYWDSEFRGEILTLNADDPCLLDDGWNDKASSIRVRKTDGDDDDGDGGQTAIAVDGQDGDWSAVGHLSSGGGTATTLKVADDASDLYLLVGGNTDGGYQFYLNTDDNAGTGFGDPARWSGTGAEYLLENGSLYAYTGSGTDFSWRAVANSGVQVAASGDVREVAIPRSALAGLGAAVRIGYTKLSTAFSVEAQLPTAGAMARYELGVDADALDGRNGVSRGASLNVYPNPAHGRVTVTYAVPRQTEVLLRVYDLTGRLEQTALSAERTEGVHTLEFDTDPLGKGVHLVRARIGDRTLVQRLLIQ